MNRRFVVPLGLLALCLVLAASDARILPEQLAPGNPLRKNATVEEITFMKDDPDCNGVCSDNEPHPICVALKSDRRVVKDVFNMCILERVNCHYKNAYVKILDTACP